MANELRHADVGTALSKTEWEATAGHIFNNQAAGDIMYASSTSQLSRLAIGSANQVLAVNSGASAPEWVTSVASATLAATVTVIDSTDTSSFIAMFDSATGSLAAKTDAGLTYNAGTGMLTATGLTGPLTGNVTGTIQTAAQGNITSLGTLTALTVDDVAVDGKVITMTGSASDTAVFTAGTNGTLSIVTTDAAAAAANIQITADGTVDIDSAGVLTLDSGAAINIEPASGSAILLDGTISVDAGVVTGATSITSTNFVGALTGNASGTAATVTGAAQSNITSLGTLTALTVDNIAIDGSTIGHTSDTDLLTLASTKLTVAGTLKITGGSPGSGKLLQSDADGDASWETVAGGGSATFTADGTIATGAMVTSSSTAGRVKQATTGHGTWSNITHETEINADSEPIAQFENSLVDCGSADRVAIVYRDISNSGYLLIQIGQYIAADEQVVWGPRTILLSAVVEQVRAAWDEVRDRIVIVYRLNSTGDLQSTVATINASTSGQSSVVYTSGNYAPDTADIAADVSALSLSAVTRLAVVANCDDTDGNTGHILVTWDSGTRIKAVVGVASGTYYNGMTWAAVQVVDDTHNHYNDSLAWDTNIDRGISTYYGSSSTVLHYRVIEIDDDDTITVGAEGTIGSSATPLGVSAATSVVFDDDTNNVVVVYLASDRHYLIAGTLATGNTASWGSAVSLDVWFGAKPQFNQWKHGYLMTVDTDSNQIVLVGAIGGEYSGDGQPSLSQLEGRMNMGMHTERGHGVYLASLSGTTVTVVNAEPMIVTGQSAKMTWQQPSDRTDRQEQPIYYPRGITYDTSTARTYITFSVLVSGGLGAGGYGQDHWTGVSKVIKAPYTPPSWIGDTGFVGFATTGVNNGESVTVTVAGGTNENQSSLTAGQRYIIFDDGILRKPSDLVNKSLITSSSRTGSLYDIQQAPAAWSIWKHEVGVATDTDKLFINFHGGLEP